jgi:hypothetical protein
MPRLLGTRHGALARSQRPRRFGVLTALFASCCLLAWCIAQVRQTPFYVNGRALSRMEISMLFVAGTHSALPCFGPLSSF